MSDKACVFIDGGYLAKVQGDLEIRRVDLLRMSTKIVGSSRRVRS